MSWLVVLALPAVLLVAFLWAGRRTIRIRHPECCGKGCGCLLPAKRKGD